MTVTAKKTWTYIRYPEDRDFLLLEISPILFVNQDEIEVVANAEFLVNLSERWGEVEATQEKSNRDDFAFRVIQRVRIFAESRNYKRVIPLAGAPSMISNLTMVSLSLYWLGTAPVVSRLIIDNSMCLILMRTNKKNIRPTMTSLRWYLVDRIRMSEASQVETEKKIMGQGRCLSTRLLRWCLCGQLGGTHFDLLYSNSICRQSSIPTSILIALFVSGGMRYECTQRSRSFTTSPIRLEIVTRTKYLLVCKHRQDSLYNA